MTVRGLFCRWKATRTPPSARELLQAVIDSADLERRYPFGGGVLRVECSQSLLDELAIFDSDDREDDERESDR